MSSGEVQKARDALAAIRTLQALERDDRSPTDDERGVLQKFPGFGPLALSLFPNPLTGDYKNATWKTLGEELHSLLTPSEYDSAKRTTFNAFYTSPEVIRAMHTAMDRLGVPAAGRILEPGCGIGNFLGHAPGDRQFVGVERDSLSGRMARILYPQHDIRVENFRDTRLPPHSLDGVIGNVPFADVRLTYHGAKYPLHDFFLAKSIDALKPGGVLAVVTSHFTLDRQNAALREALGDQADFLGAIRLPSEAFKREGTSVVTDILFLRKRGPDERAHHVDADWLQTGSLSVEGADVTVNQYFLNHPEMVLGTWSRQNTMYGRNGYSVTGHGDLSEQLPQAIRRLPRAETAAVDGATMTEASAGVSKPRFVPPPDQSHIAEGSFFVSADRTIRQICDGEATPVRSGQNTLRSDRTMSGRRLAHLIRLRDQARRVLQSQLEAWPDEHRDAARRELNQTYDRFVATYGPINKTTFSETSSGSVVRRMPNLVKFRDDPDAMLVMSLENYDEVSGQARKSAILERDVVGPPPPVTTVNSAEEGLLVSLNRHGRVDLDLIAELYGHSVEDVIAELGDLIFQNPATDQWETADEYLSGNVRQKLAHACEAGPEFARNVSRLEAVQPEDLLPGEIDASPGSPWIPAEDIEAFAADLFGVDRDTVSVSHLQRDAVWKITSDGGAETSVAATSDYGTQRVNGLRLLELALNMTSPTVYDRIQTADREERVVNQSETLAAREKQKRIKDRFRSWVFQDPDRAERLVRIYNDTYNNLRPRLFDGSHLDFPGMTNGVSLRPHQKAAVWRCMSSGNTLLAHVVGAGKTYTMAAAGMKMKQAGLVHKPMYVVPNHLLEQFAREFLHLYPHARLLVAGKEDLRRDRRRLLTAKIASGDWDGIIVTHSSFERIGMSKPFLTKFLEQQIAEYDDLLVDHATSRKANRNVLKLIEKQKAAHAERLHQLVSAEHKDDGLVFDELGVDHVFIDEAHLFKNLETPSKMDRVAGVQTGGSKRAFDVYLKARWLSEQHPGHGVTFATGTPVSNTMVELYNLQRFLDPEGLQARGIEHFDAWAATFGEVVDTMEIAPDGAGLRPRSRFARFVNLPELQQMFRAFADVQTADQLDLPRPKLKSGKPITVACPMSPEQQALQQELVARYERVRSEKLDPRVDNALAITTDGRKLATDARMLDADAEDFPDSKVNRLVENVHRIWLESADRKGTQIIFADMGVNPTEWGYSPYDEIVHKLMARGIPSEQIATMGSADTDARKQALFERVRQGDVRVLLGSTQKMGTGTNVQKRLMALHHLDAPWKPAEVEQREGRILRQGNLNPEVSVYRYVTEGSFDAYMWQALETKARFIGQVITDTNAARQAEDTGGQELSYAEVKAIASGNPAVLTLAEADAELRRLAMLRRNHLDDQFVTRRRVRDLPEIIDRLKDRLGKLEQDRQVCHQHEGPALVIGGRSIPAADAVAVLGGRLDALPADVRQQTRIPLGTWRGLTFAVVQHPGAAANVVLEGALARSRRLSSASPGPRAVLNALERLAETYDHEIAATRQDRDRAESQLKDYRDRLGTRFADEDRIRELTELRNQLQMQLTGATESETSESGPEAESVIDRIRALVDRDNRVKVERSGIPRRTEVGEEPVTVRIRRRAEEKLGSEPPDTGQQTGFRERVLHERQAKSRESVRQ